MQATARRMFDGVSPLGRFAGCTWIPWQVLALDRIAFNQLLGSLEEIIQAQEDGRTRPREAWEGPELYVI